VEIDPDEKIKKDKTTFNNIKDVDYYYLDKDNYKDDVPFDLYNMVSLAKRIDFKTKTELEMTDITGSVIKSQFDQMNDLKSVDDLARKHLPKQVIKTGFGNYQI